MPTQVADDKADLLGHLAAIFQGTVWCTKKIKEAKGIAQAGSRRL